MSAVRLAGATRKAFSQIRVMHFLLGGSTEKYNKTVERVCFSRIMLKKKKKKRTASSFLSLLLLLLLDIWHQHCLLPRLLWEAFYAQHCTVKMLKGTIYKNALAPQNYHPRTAAGSLSFKTLRISLLHLANLQ